MENVPRFLPLTGPIFIPIDYHYNPGPGNGKPNFKMYMYLMFGLFLFQQEQKIVDSVILSMIISKVLSSVTNVCEDLLVRAQNSWTRTIGQR